VDANVGDHIFQKGIRCALKGKTILLVTHLTHLLPECDWVILIKDGAIYAQGTSDELSSRGIDFNEVILLPEEEEEHPLPPPSEKLRTRTASSEHAALSNPLPEIEAGGGIEAEAEIPVKEISGKLMTIEEKTGGQVSLEMYSWYFQRGGVGYLVIATIVSLAGAGSFAYSSFYLSRWGRIAYEASLSGEPLSTQENLHYLNRFGLYSSMAIIATTIRTFMFVVLGIQASRALHRLLLSGVVQSTIAHFDTTPIGRIINRFASDLTVTDETLATNMSFFLAMVSTLLGIIGSLGYTTKGAIFILFCPLMLIYYFLQLYFRRSNTELKRLENVTRSPIYAEFNQALGGVKSLRSYHLEEMFVRRMEDFVDLNSNIWRTQQLLKWWLSIRLETMGGMVSCFIAILAAAKTNLIDDQYVSLSLQAAFSLVITMKYLMAMGPEVEAMMNSVERIRYYSESIEPEETAEVTKRYSLVMRTPTEKTLNEHSSEQQQEQQWPEHGKISFRNVSMSYHDGPLVLKGVSFEISPHEKVGIAGRTGCGKSSLMVALYRFENLQGGCIEIDGIDISTVPLETLRSRIGIIPQDPVLFSVTVRFNLDPLDHFSDEEIWSALDSVCMKDVILSLPLQLHEPVSEGGENFSVGQRQLLCIARLLLRKPKILVMDESTSSIDNETDALIQKMIRSQFSECTVLTIAHRLHTVIDSDRILVLENGYVRQFGPPSELIQEGEGLFGQLWRKHVSSRSIKKIMEGKD
jgi:ABC-type multidrug transport system fused ATPase/permease subunit